MAIAAQPDLSPLGGYLFYPVPAAVAIGMIVFTMLKAGSDVRNSLCATALLATLLLSIIGIAFSNIVQVRHLLPESMLAYAAMSVMLLRPFRSGAEAKR
jgi:hypothetical protein